MNKGTYFVYRDGVNPYKNAPVFLKDGTMIRGGYEAAYSKSLKDALVYAWLTARNINGNIYTHNREGRLVKVTGGAKAHKKYQEEGAKNEKKNLPYEMPNMIRRAK